MYVLLLIYFIFIFYLTIRGYDREKSDASYFFSSYKTTTTQSYISIFATETSVATILIFPAVGFEKNFNIIFLCIGYIIGRIIIAFFYIKHYHKISTLSLYEYISTKDSKKYLSFAYLLAKYISGSVRFYLAGYGLSQLTGISIELWLTGILILIAVYSLTGGLNSVILTDQIQGLLILVSGFFFVLYLGNHNSLLLKNLNTNISFDIYKSLYLLLGGILLTISSHGGDQDILQRIFSVEKLKDAQKSLVISGFLASIVILLFVLVGYFLLKHPNLNPKSPLLDYIYKLDNSFISLIIKNIFIVVVVAAAMSTLDSSIHSTGAIWKSIFLDLNKNFINYFYSLISLILMYLFSICFVFIETQKDFLSFALGFMNYVNGTLFASITLFVLYRKKLNTPVIFVTLLSNITITIICEYFSLYFALTTIISFFIAFLCGWFIMQYYEKNYN